jgi:hypothetical protein
MSTQYRLVQSGKTASGGCSAGQGSSELWRLFLCINLVKFHLLGVVVATKQGISILHRNEFLTMA